MAGSFWSGLLRAPRRDKEHDAVDMMNDPVVVAGGNLDDDFAKHDAAPHLEQKHIPVHLAAQPSIPDMYSCKFIYVPGVMNVMCDTNDGDITHISAQ